MTPEKNRPIDTKSTPQSIRRVVQLAELAELAEVENVPAPRAEYRPSVAMPAPAVTPPRDRWLRVAELVVGDWAPTLREALVRVLVFVVVLAALAVTLGGETAVLGAVVGFVMFLVGRRRAEADR
jgi:hypothetical protein